MNIRQLNNPEYEKATTLALDVFIECGSADFDVNGLQTFKSFIHNNELMNELCIFGHLIMIILSESLEARTEVLTSRCVSYILSFIVGVLAGNYLILPMSITLKRR